MSSGELSLELFQVSTLLEVALGLRAHQDARVRRAVAYAMLVSFQAGGALQLSSECALHFSAPELRP